MLPINFINALPATQSISAEDKSSKPPQVKRRKIKQTQKVYFAAIIPDTPGII